MGKKKEKSEAWGKTSSNLSPSQLVFSFIYRNNAAALPDKVLNKSETHGTKKRQKQSKLLIEQKNDPDKDKIVLILSAATQGQLYFFWIFFSPNSANFIPSDEFWH